MDEIEAVFNRKDMTFEEAVKYFKERVPVSASVFYRIAEKYRGLAFTVGGYTKAQILKRFYDEILAALEDGNTLSEFRSRMNEFLTSEGYEGLDPLQADLIFRTNIQTAYNVGHYEQMTDPGVMKLRPYWQYDAVNDAHTRPSHLAMDGRVFPADSAVWDSWFPPNGFRCRCMVVSLSKKQVERMGLHVETEAPYDVDYSTGEILTKFPDKGFSNNPAKTVWKPDMTNISPELRKMFRERKQPEDGETK